MRLDVEDILRLNGLSKTIKIEFCAKEMGIVADDCEFDRPVVLEADVTNINGIIRIKGKVCTGYSTFCARCLKPVNCEISARIDEEFSKEGGTSSGDCVYTREGAYTYRGKSIELDCAVNDAILLRIPIKHLCNEDCKSLCPKCGKDLNFGDCGCDGAEVDERFEGLRGYFI